MAMQSEQEKITLRNKRENLLFSPASNQRQNHCSVLPPVCTKIWV